MNQRRTERVDAEDTPSLLAPNGNGAIRCLKVVVVSDWEDLHVRVAIGSV